MAWSPPNEVGDHDPSIVEAKRKLRVYSYGKGLGETDEYTAAFGVALRQFQINRNQQILRGQVTGMPGMNVEGVLDWATKKNLLILPEQLNPPRVPVIITVAGHLGPMDSGPAYLTARWLEERKLVRIQMVGYDNAQIPFDNDSGEREFLRLINDPTVLPPGTDWAVGSHSQGGIITSDVIEDGMKQRDQWPWNHFKGGVHFANPRRPMGVVAPWVTDPPDPDSEGLAHNCLKAALPGVAEVSRKGDLYADKKRTQSAEYKTAVYRAVAEGDFISGTDTLGEQMLELVTSGGIGLWHVFQAITSGVVGASKLGDKHGIFDLGPCVDHFRRVLAI
jgi:hypothetical protein